MNSKRTFTYLISILLYSIISSCQSDCDCGDTPPYVTDLIFTTIKTTSVDNSGNWPSFEKEATTIPYKAIGLRIAITDTVKREIVANVEYKGTQTQCSSWLLGDYDIICDWFGPAGILKKKISALRIVTLHDFSSEYPAGTEISSLFKASLRQFSFEEYLYIELDSVIQLYNRAKYHDPGITNFDLVLAQPALCDSMLLEVSVEFDDNSALTDTTNAIYPIK